MKMKANNKRSQPFNRERRENPNGHRQRRQDNAQTGYGQREQQKKKLTKPTSGYAQRDSRPGKLWQQGTLRST